MKKITAILMLFTMGMGFSQSAGSLDPSFGNGGVVILDDYLSAAGDVLLQPDGKILVAGVSNFLKLWRFNSDGSLDTTFAGNTSIYAIYVSNMAVQQDGKIVVACEDQIVRFHPDGSLDLTFGNAGVVQSAQNIQISALILDNDKLIIGGEINNAASIHSISLARYNSNGTLDESFAGGVKTITISPYDKITRLSDLAVDSAHRIVACGYYIFDGLYFSSSNSNNFVCRVNEDGTMDADYAGDGILIVDQGSFYNIKFNESNSIILRENGSILIAGTKGTSPSTRDFAIYETSATGDLSHPDMPFTYGFAGNQKDVAKCMAIDNNGKIILAGITGYSYYDNSFALLRLNQDYAPDVSFGNNGRATALPQNLNSRISNIAVQPDDKIIVVGTTTLTENGNNKFCIARFLGSTTLDVNQNEPDSTIVVYPNPVTDILYVTPDGLAIIDKFYQIVDINGRTLLKGQNQINTFQINIESLAKGMYFLKISDKVNAIKIIKN